MRNSASENISIKFANLLEKAHKKRLLTNNMSKKFVKEFKDLQNVTNAMLNLKKRKN
jgi:hypothetical protein